MGRLVWLWAALALGACGDDGGAAPADAGVLTDGAADAGRDRVDAGPSMRVLSVRTSGDGMGVVAGADGAIACGDGMTDCNVAVPLGTEVTLEASAAGPSVFAGWSGDGIDCADDATCTVTVDGSTRITASFDLDDLSLMVTTDGTGSGSVTSDPTGVDCPDTCAASYTALSEVTLTATPDDSSVFAGWSGACEGAEDTCTVTLDEARSVNATFDLREVTLEVELVGDGGGSVSSDVGGIDCGATCSTTVAFGTAVTLTATPLAVSSAFAGYTGCTGTGDTCTVEVAGDTVVQASFALHRYDLDVTRAGAGSGTVISSAGGIDCGADCTETYAYGTTVTLTASPDAATSLFTGWSGACEGESSSTCTVGITEATSVTATFELLTRTLHVAPTGTGAGTIASAPAGIDCGGDCSEDYPHGTTVTLTATADPATSTFVGWSGACAAATTDTCDVDMTAVRSATARFDLAQRQLEVSLEGAGTGLVTSSPGSIYCGPDCTATFAHGTSVTLTASPASGASFGGWGGACATEPSVLCTVLMSSAQSVTAIFDP